MSQRLNDYIQPLMALLILIVIVGAAFMVVAPFIIATLWAVILVTATWEPFCWLSARLGGRDGIAATCVVTLLALFILLPLVLASVEFAQQLTLLARELQHQIEAGIWPELPLWLKDIPYLGDWIQTQWLALQQQDIQA